MYIKKGKGFTLIELMVVVAIVAILAALAYPSYTKSVRKGHRADAMQSLQNLRTNQSQWRANHATYATTLASVGFGSGLSGEGYYTIAFVGAPDTTTFVATAAPNGSQAADSCGTYSINQNGPNKSGSYANARCWNQ
jgi:type IV pilus assembly protein PilE